MKDLYADFTKDELWLIEEPHWQRDLQNIRESQFTLGNGYLGIRGVLEEIPYDAIPGTYIAGVYDNVGSQVDEIVNFPNPVNFKFTIEGEKLDLVATDTLEHSRTLNMKKAVLTRRTLYQDTKGNRYNYQSLRFISQYHKNIGVIQIAVTPLDAACSLDINTGIDTSISNAGILSEGRKRHFRVRELGQSENAGYLAVETLEKRHVVIYWSGFYYQINGRKTFAKDNIFCLKLKKGKTIIFTKVFYIRHFPYKEDLASYKKESFRMFNQVFRSRLAGLLEAHLRIWERLWRRADIEISGTKNMQENMRFNIYHMLICAHYDRGFSSIGARTLSGEGYRGHIFWDAEIFLLPFYLFTFPRVAQNMLLYRYNRLQRSRELAEKEGFKGAKFAWESADTGEDETPEWSKDFDGTVIKIYTHRQEQHITADIAYAVYKYYLATDDNAFMERCGYEMIFATARFWASRVEYNKRRKKYEINNIMGPDEFHRQVNNNAFTNMMAKWNLVTAYRLYGELKRKKPAWFNRLRLKLDLRDKQTQTWKKIAALLAVNVNDRKVIEQFDGYFKLRRVTLSRTDENGIPLIPPSLRPKNLLKTNLIKQSDVVMLLYLLNDVYSLQTKLANYNFYISKTVHKSSLSPSIHALLGAELGDLSRAYNLFKVSLRADISNVYGNTHEGIHAASLGGTWQAFIFGFAGLKIKKDTLTVNPHLPRAWNKVRFYFLWKNDLIRFELTNDTIKLKVNSRKRKGVELGIFNKSIQVGINRTYTFKRRSFQAKQEGFY